MFYQKFSGDKQYQPSTRCNCRRVGGVTHNAKRRSENARNTRFVKNKRNNFKLFSKNRAFKNIEKPKKPKNSLLINI